MFAMMWNSLLDLIGPDVGFAAPDRAGGQMPFEAQIAQQKGHGRGGADARDCPMVIAGQRLVEG
jgi:hypothetical protein